jgi:hypothetical protein
MQPAGVDRGAGVEIINGKIEELKAATAREFWDLLSPEKPLFPHPCRLLFRGQKDARWGLEPRVFRAGNNPAALWSSLQDPHSLVSDEQVFAEWKFLEMFMDHCDSIGLKLPNDSCQFRDKYFTGSCPAGPAGSLINTSLWPPKELFELMALAQHHGLPTRLLDWTKRSHVAAYFAVSDALAANGNSEDSEEKRIVVWVLDIEKKGLFRELEVVRVPGSTSSNLAAQAGVFTLLRQQGTRGQPFQGTTSLDEYLSGQSGCPLKIVTLPVGHAPEVMDLCSKYHITAATLFPDYYGASRAAIDDLHRWSHPRAAR